MPIGSGQPGEAMDLMKAMMNGFTYGIMLGMIWDMEGRAWFKILVVLVMTVAVLFIIGIT